MRWSSAALLLGMLSASSACSGGDEGARDAGSRDAGQTDAGSADAGSADAGARDAGVDRDAGPRIDGGASACPTAADYVGDASWAGALVLPSGLELCRYAGQFEPMASVLRRRRRMFVAPGTYALPLEIEDAPARIPMCFRGDATPAITTGEVDAVRRSGIDDPFERYRVTVTMPVTDGTRVELRVPLPTDTPLLTIDGPVAEYDSVRAAHCTTPSCFEETDSELFPCALQSRMCDRLTFTDGEVAIDQFHWSGSIGAGFAAAARVRGTFRGTPFDITAYDQLALAYGHHAFNRELHLTFDAPIDGICALHFAEVTEFGQLQPVDLIDCEGTTVGSSPITADTHAFGTPCDG